jgi:hypothetical protein
MAVHWAANNFEWTGLQGNWQFSGNVAEQKDADYPNNTLCWTSIPCTDFIMAPDARHLFREEPRLANKIPICRRGSRRRLSD